MKAGDAAASELHKRLLLPKDNDDRMPPEGEPLSADQITAIRNWINEGANWPDGVVIQAATKAAPATPAPAVASTTPAAPPKPAVPAPERPKDFKPAAAEATALAVLGKNGIERAPWPRGFRGAR